MSFDKKLRELRKKTGMSQKELAAASGLSIATIQGYEQGKYEPKADASAKLLAALGITDEPYKLFDHVVLRADFGDGEKEYALDSDGVAAFWVTERDELLRNYDSVTEDGKRLIEDYVKLIASHPDYKDK